MPAEVRRGAVPLCLFRLVKEEKEKKKKERRMLESGGSSSRPPPFQFRLAFDLRERLTADGRRQTTARRRPHLGEVRPVKFHASCAMRMQLLARKRERERHEIVKSGWEKQLTFRVHKCFGLIKHLFSDLNKNSDVPDLLFLFIYVKMKLSNKS